MRQIPDADGEARLAEFRAALEEIARSPVLLPDGRSYVDALRAADLRRLSEIDRRQR